ncbi:hypothetical protein ACH5RR_011292 [Cinchona calisaya]|uniref:BHLH domain-containing protein n=1 Tax=Cinchona calisaya TaxID=153742 RepID=A0ABD3A4I0_9GENT
MVRAAKKSHHQQDDDEIDDEEFASTFGTPDVSSRKMKVEGKSNNQKVNVLRSKHSETEQRRRSKINERFQILRDLIPENDQKRDKASFLLEVIQYIQFLQEKIQMYEGPYQGWSAEPSKLMPWRSNSGLVENYVDQPQVMMNGLGHEDNIIVAPTLLSNAQNSMESELNGVPLYRSTDHPEESGNLENSLNLPVQPNSFEVVSSQPPQGSFPDPENSTSQSPPEHWQSKLGASKCAVPGFNTSHQEQLNPESGEASISSVYSQGLLNTLTLALQSSGVDLSKAKISVQLDIGKRSNGTTATTLIKEDSSSIQQMAGCRGGIDPYDHADKKLKTDQS